MAVIADLKEWFFNLRGDSRTTGNLAMKQARSRQTKWRRLSQQRQQQGFFSPVIELVMDEENEENLVDNDEVRIDFRPLYQCIHIHDQLGFLNDFRKNYAEDRQAQIDLILSLSISLANAEGFQSLEKLLQEVVGFFVVEHVVVYTTHNFRSKAAVDVVWTVVSDKVTRVIAESASTCNDAKRLFHVRKLLMTFVSALESYMYDTKKPRELMVILAERYALLLMEACSERFKLILNDDEFRPMVVSKQEELDAVRTLYRFDDAIHHKFPCSLPFSPALPQCHMDIRSTITDYYSYIAGEDGQAAVIVADSVAMAAVDHLIIKTVIPLMLSRLRINDITFVVQVIINMEHFERSLADIEGFLTKQRISQVEDKLILRSHAAFQEAKTKSSKRVFELVHLKIDQFLEVSNYNWTPTQSLFTTGQYLVDLVNYLKNVLPKVLEDVPVQIKSFMYLDSLDYLATALLNLWFGDHVPEFNALFVATADIDLCFLEQFVEELNNPQLLDTFVELRQTVNLLISDNREEYLDIQVRNRKYNRLKPGTVIALFEKMHG